MAPQWFNQTIYQPNCSSEYCFCDCLSERSCLPAAGGDDISALHHVIFGCRLMPERLFRYVDPWRVRAYAALVWNAIGECQSPHEKRPKAIIDWINAGKPVEPPERTVVQISAEEFSGLVLEGDVVTSAAPIVAYMAKQRWTRCRVHNRVKMTTIRGVRMSVEDMRGSRSVRVHIQ